MPDDYPGESITHPPDYTIAPKQYRTYRLIKYILGVVEVLLAFRFVLKFLAANPTNIFAEIIYGITHILILPFATIFGSPATSDELVQNTFEPSTVIAMIAYALIAWGAARLFLIFHSKPKEK